MNTQAEIYEEMEKLIPTELWEKYSYLSFENMAEIPELASILRNQGIPAPSKEGLNVGNEEAYDRQ